MIGNPQCLINKNISLQFIYSKKNTKTQMGCCMRYLKRLISCCVIVLILWLSTLLFSPEITWAGCCPSGYAYNSSTLKCEAEPICPGGTYNANLNVCTTDATFTCPSGYTFNLDAFYCLGDVLCACGGTLYFNPGPGCKKGTAPPPCDIDCGYGTSYNDPEPGTCRGSATCPVGGYASPWQYNGTYYCHSPVTISCPTGYTFWSDWKICNLNGAPTCPSGGIFSSSFDKCIATPIIDGQTQSCYSGPAGTENVGECKAGTQTCTNGQWGGCAGEITPQSEMCDGKDYNCNDDKDEGCFPKPPADNGRDSNSCQ